MCRAYQTTVNFFPPLLPVTLPPMSAAAVVAYNQPPPSPVKMFTLLKIMNASNSAVYNNSAAPVLTLPAQND